MEPDHIVTVRPDEPVDTLQRLPAFVGISDATAGSSGIGMNLVIIPPGAAADAHFHDGFETAIFLLSGRVRERVPYLGGIRPERLSGRESSQHPRRFPP
jgi:uncharacterized RmlC-like cupin family protein